MYSAVLPPSLMFFFRLQKSDKGQIFYWQSQTCTRIRQFFVDWLSIFTMLKNLKTALFQTFSTWHRILSAFTALYWPCTAFYWPSTTKYQPVPPYTDPYLFLRLIWWVKHSILGLVHIFIPRRRADDEDDDDVQFLRLTSYNPIDEWSLSSAPAWRRAAAAEPAAMVLVVNAPLSLLFILSTTSSSGRGVVTGSRGLGHGLGLGLGLGCQCSSLAPLHTIDHIIVRQRSSNR